MLQTIPFLELCLKGPIGCRIYESLNLDMTKIDQQGAGDRKFKFYMSAKSKIDILNTKTNDKLQPGAGREGAVAPGLRC